MSARGDYQQREREREAEGYERGGTSTYLIVVDGGGGDGLHDGRVHARERSGVGRCCAWCCLVVDAPDCDGGGRWRWALVLTRGGATWRGKVRR